MSTPHRATPAQWADVEWFADPERHKPESEHACILELRDRLAAAEQRISGLEAGATCPHIITTDEGTSYCGLAEQQAVASAPPKSALIGSLMDRVDHAIASADEDCLAPSWAPEARAAIRAVAEWLRGHHPDGDPVAAIALEREAER